ncbi:probable serine/threonine-protein kinase At1g54610 isoform X2 [Zingiber officinale]|uniref:probable serine/threonine-protein kinase At1g54610 isoform X2 n=1 Tax=Zingiber officinale TaxID=94328 RepID=UPI001C4AA4F0|nr:probable serine/threonine-protein kinase At1g54610 isoform X2 [Zingiber officinale]
MGCAWGKPLPVEDSRRRSPPERSPLPPLPAAGALQVDAPAKRTAVTALAASSLRREEAIYVRTEAGVEVAAAAAGKKVVNKPARANWPDAERRRVAERQAQRKHPMQVFGSVPKAVEGEQVAAGWPAWLATVAGEAIMGWVPRKADSFEKLDKIGQGTYSSVYRARDLDNKKIVALKKVRFDNLEPESVKFMAREILILRRLDHPNIVKLEGLVTSRMSCSLYLVFEYMEHDLAGLASSPGLKFSEPQVKCYMQQLLHGLGHCHNREILHRDIKGSNLLIDDSGILKIADFGLASFFDPEQRLPLTSRVVTLWYRPPELLLGATNYGVSVDLWSAGCILAELYAGKPIMPGRTEVEQLHKIFKLCGSPSEEYWRKSRLPHATIFKPQQPYRRCVAEAFKDFPPSALTLLEVLLSVDPADRGTAASALKNEFFTRKPLACDPSSLPKYPPSKEFDSKRREEEARRQGATGGNVHKLVAEKGVQRESKAIPAPDANAELTTSLQKRQAQANSRSRSEKFDPRQEDIASGFPIEPPQVAPVLEVAEEPQKQLCNRSFHSGPLVHRSQLPKAWKNAENLPKIFAAADLSGLPEPATGRRKVLSDDGDNDLITHLGGSPAGRLSESGNKSSNNRKRDQIYHQREDESSYKIDQQTQGYRPKGNKIHYSGPLLRPSGNVDQMLKDHDRQIQEVFRRSRINKTKIRKHQGDGNQFGVKPDDFIPMPLYPSTRGSSIPVFTSSHGSAR